MRSQAPSHLNLLGKLVRYPLRLVPPTMVVPILSGQLRGKRWLVGSGVHKCWLGRYEPDKQQLISRYVLPNTVFFDIGANVGFYSLLASMLVGAGKVFSFEPLPRNISYLKRNLALNHASNVDVQALAISDKNGVGKFQVEHENAEGHLSSEGDITVPVAAIDSLIREGKIHPPNYIKMDIEGAEYQALLGARMCFEQYQPILFLATHGKEVHEQCCDLLKSWGYRLTLLGKPVRDLAELFAAPERECKSGGPQVRSV
jgi:FkbM family methyltransferase